MRYLLMESKLRSSIVEDNVQKTSFFLLLSKARCGHEVHGKRCTFRARNPICLDPPTPYELAKSVAKVVNIYGNSWIIRENSYLKEKRDTNYHKLAAKRVRRPQEPKAILMNNHVLQKTNILRQQGIAL